MTGMAASFAGGHKRKQFALGTLIGEVQIPIADLSVGGACETKWLPLTAVHSGNTRGLAGEVTLNPIPETLNPKT
jgi:hypothetical protein